MESLSSWQALNNIDTQWREKVSTIEQSHSNMLGTGMLCMFKDQFFLLFLFHSHLHLDLEQTHKKPRQKRWGPYTKVTFLKVKYEIFRWTQNVRPEIVIIFISFVRRGYDNMTTETYLIWTHYIRQTNADFWALIYPLHI